MPDERTYRTYRSFRRWADWVREQEYQKPETARMGSGWTLRR